MASVVNFVFFLFLPLYEGPLIAANQPGRCGEYFFYPTFYKGALVLRQAVPPWRRLPGRLPSYLSPLVLLWQGYDHLVQTAVCRDHTDGSQLLKPATVMWQLSRHKTLVKLSSFGVPHYLHQCHPAKTTHPQHTVDSNSACWCRPVTRQPLWYSVPRSWWCTGTACPLA